MGDTIENECNFYYSVGLFETNVNKCTEGTDDFNEDIGPIVELCHEVGKARLDKDDTGPKGLSKKLKAQSKPIEKKYKKYIKACDEKGDARACGYVTAYDTYVDNNGPLSAIKHITDPSETLDLKRAWDGYILVDLSNGLSEEILFDSGAEFSAFSLAYYDDHEANFSSLWPKNNLFVVSGIMFKIGSSKFYPHLATTTETLDFMGGVEPDHDLIALLGTDYLLNAPYEVDYDNFKITFSPDIEKRLGEHEDWKYVPMTVVPTVAMSTAIAIEVFVNGTPMRYLLDTGGVTSIRSGCLPQLDSASIAAENLVYDIDGSKTVDVMESLNIRVGEVEAMINQHVATEDDSFGKKLKQYDFCGTLGANFLMNVNYILDPFTHGIYMRENKSYSKSLDGLSLGITPLITEDGLLLEIVDPGKMFAEAGLKSGDLVVEIAGVEGKSIRLLGLWDLFVTDSDKVSVKYLRDGKKHETYVKMPK